MANPRPTEQQISDSMVLDHIDKMVLRFRFGYVDGAIKSLDEAARMFETTRYALRQREARAYANLCREYGWR